MPQVLEKMSSLRGQPFQDACDIFSILKEHPEIHAGLLKDQLYREDMDQNGSCLGANHPFGVVCSNLIGCQDHFGLDWR